MKTIRIVSNGVGTGGHTKVYDEETGNELAGVESIEIFVRPEEGKVVTRAKVTFVMPKIEGTWAVLDGVPKLPALWSSHPRCDFCNEKVIKSGTLGGQDWRHKKNNMWGCEVDGIRRWASVNGSEIADGRLEDVDTPPSDPKSKAPRCDHCGKKVVDDGGGEWIHKKSWAYGCTAGVKPWASVNGSESIDGEG